VTAHDVELLTAWQRHVSSDTGPLDGLLARHREKHRRYHGVDHVVWVLRHVDELVAEESVDDPAAIAAAAFYHDAVYEPAYPANERASARLARRDLDELGWHGDRIDRVSDMIEATSTHDAPHDVDTAVLIDADLAVLAADPAAYQDYVEGVRSEYRNLDDAEWADGRSDVLQRFLDRAAIFTTGTGQAKWEARARANIAAELASLASPT
jgi:predicted metal-dependent HD superfamily phosphohydrolase